MSDKGKIIKSAEICLKHIDESDCPQECPYFEQCSKYERRVVFQPLIRDALALLKERDWVKCSDRMPEERESIFAKFKGTDKWSPAMFSGSSEDVRVVVVFADGTRRVSHSHTIDGKWECEKHPLKRTVTHWMPNPELPNEGGEVKSLTAAKAGNSRNRTYFF